MTPLEKKKIEAELARVRAARLEMEVRLAELEEAIERISKDALLHLNKEKELEVKLSNEI